MSSTLRNFGTAGPSLNATNNGLISVDKAVWFPGAELNGLATQMPHALTGNLEIVWHQRMGTVLATDAWPVASWPGATSLQSFYVAVNSAGRVFFSWADTGGIVATLDATANVPGGVTDVPVWLKVLFQADNGASGHTATFFYSNESAFPTSSWIEYNEVVGVGITSIRNPSELTLSREIGLGSYGAYGGTISHVTVSDDNGAFFTFDAATDLLGIDPSATSFICTSGQTITVNRGTSGPVTVLAPKPVLINPDEADTAIKVTVPDNAAWDIAIGDDAIVCWAGQAGNIPAVNAYFMDPVGRTANDRVSLQARAAGATRAAYHDGTNLIVPSATNADRHKLVANMSYLDRAQNRVYYRVYDITGLIDSGSADATALGAISPDAAYDFMYQVPGTMTDIIFKKGVGIAPTDKQVSDMANYLLGVDVPFTPNALYDENFAYLMDENGFNMFDSKVS